MTFCDLKKCMQVLFAKLRKAICVPQYSKVTIGQSYQNWQFISQNKI